MVVQLGLHGEHVGSPGWPAGWTCKANYHRAICGAAFRSFFLLSPLNSQGFKSIFVQLWMFVVLYLSPNPTPLLSLLVQINTVPEPSEGWVLVGWVIPRRHGLWTHKSMVCPDIDVKTIRWPCLLPPRYLERTRQFYWATQIWISCLSQFGWNVLWWFWKRDGVS